MGLAVAGGGGAALATPAPLFRLITDARSQTPTLTGLKGNASNSHRQVQLRWQSGARLRPRPAAAQGRN